MTQKFESMVLEECQYKKNIFIFVSKKDEIDTKEAIIKILGQEKRVIVPICNNYEKKILLSTIESIRDLEPSTHGILEPKIINLFPKEKIDVYFVPGTKFDEKGNRKGRGMGYFDRFLKDVKGKAPIIGLCYEKQIVPELKTESWDIPVDKIITEKREITISQS